MYKVTMKEKYEQTGKKLYPCCKCFIPFGYSTHIFGLQLCNTIQCICCHKKVRARTLEKTIDKWNNSTK